jgi:integrin alpha FG-GAP repeat containing protein 1
VNQDGFPDLLAIIATGPGLRRDHTPYLAYSVSCSKGTPGCGSKGHGRRGWSVLKKGAEALSAVKDARSIAFLDMDEDVSFGYNRFMDNCYYLALFIGQP